MDSDGFGSFPEVWTGPVRETGFPEPEVLRRFRVPKVPFPKVIVCFESVSMYFESVLF